MILDFTSMALTMQNLTFIVVSFLTRHRTRFITTSSFRTITSGTLKNMCYEWDCFTKQSKSITHITKLEL